MSSTSGTKALGWTVAATLVAGATLGGCSDIYYDRRETIALGADDAIASNRVTHMVDPWPPSSANRNIAFNGERMGCAVERYRRNTVIQPRQVTTSSAASQSAPQASDTVAPCAAGAPQGAPSAAAVAPQGASPPGIK
jgi:hypothetical protein